MAADLSGLAGDTANFVSFAKVLEGSLLCYSVPYMMLQQQAYFQGVHRTLVQELSEDFSMLARQFSGVH
jgi:hypothetical protein